MQHYVQLLQGFKIVSINGVRMATLTFWRHMTSSDSWPFDLPLAIPYRSSIGTDTLSPKVFEILRLKCIWVTVLAFLGHVTSSVTWSLFTRYVVSYRCSIDTNSLSWAVCEILSLKHTWVATLTFRVMWRHRSRDHWIRHGPLPIGVLLALTLYLQRISRYWGSNVSGSRSWPF